MMTETEEFRRKEPAPLEPRPLRIPTPSETILANGLKLIIVEDSRLPLVSYRLALLSGDANDPIGRPGLTDMMVGLLTEGTQSRTSREIADQVARIGATLTAGANADYTTVAGSALSLYNAEILDLIADVALRPSFPEGEIQIARQNTKQMLIQQRAQPSFLATERVSRIIFGEHPYGTIATTPDSLDAMTREELTDFHAAMFVPNNSLLIVVGDVNTASVVKQVNDLFGKWDRKPRISSKLIDLPKRTERAIYLVDRPGSAQSNIVIATLAITRTSADYFPMLLMHTILGANASSRLFMNLREQKGYTYGAYSSLDARREAGTFRASAEVRTPVTGASLHEFFLELERIRNEEVSEKELQDAKSYLTGVFPLRIETQEGLTDQIAQIRMYDLPADYLETYRERVNAVTVADVQRVAREYITPDTSAIVIVGDSAEIMDEVKPFAKTIELYDVTGKRKEPKLAAAPGSDGHPREPVRLDGVWKLEVAAPTGDIVPATLHINQSAESFSGKVESELGNSDLSDGKITLDRFRATISMTVGNQKVAAGISGTANNNCMEGIIALDVPNAPSILFTGAKAD